LLRLGGTAKLKKGVDVAARVEQLANQLLEKYR
jgi:hypothetical protein